MNLPAVGGPVALTRTNFASHFWGVEQMIAHHTVNGCHLRTGDLLGSGTVSGPGATEAGSMVELSQGGKIPVQLTPTETRRFLENGDEIVLRGRCRREGFAPIGFGECRGRIAAGHQ
ncbi:fumarylacetoacetate hydrolase family protein [Phycobium rhodophyticola]